MKKISKKAIEKQVRKEHKIAHQWCKNIRGCYYKMMLDTHDGEILSDVFLTGNDWKEYHSDSIKYLDCEIGYVDDAIRYLKEAGWEVVE